MLIKHRFKYNGFIIHIEEYYTNNILNDYREVNIIREEYYDASTKILHKRCCFSCVQPKETLKLISIKRFINDCVNRLQNKIVKEYDRYIIKYSDV